MCIVPSLLALPSHEVKEVTDPMQITLAVYCWPPHVQAEGENAVLNNLQQAGVNTVSTVACVAEQTDATNYDRHEPLNDGSKGMVRIVDRPLWIKCEQYLRSGPSFPPNSELYKGMKYAPSEPNDLIASQGKAHRRGMKTSVLMAP